MGILHEKINLKKIYFRNSSILFCFMEFLFKTKVATILNGRKLEDGDNLSNSMNHVHTKL